MNLLKRLRNLQKGLIKEHTIRCAARLLSCFSRVQHFATPLNVAHQAPLSMEFSRQEYWSGLPCPPPGDLPDPGIESTSLTSLTLAVGSLPTWVNPYN